MRLHHELLGAPGATRAVAFLHGILGSGANLRSHARRFIDARPDFAAVLIDLRAHGDSLGDEGPDTLEQAARDVAQTAAALTPPLHAVVGHSFGGKVALALAQLEPSLAAVLTLDSAPGPRLDARGSESTVQVLSMLEGLTGPWPTRDAFIAEVEQQGQPRALAQWLAMNLGQRERGFHFRLALPRIRALLEDYFAVDLWPVVERAARTQTGPRVHLVIAARSGVYSPADRTRAQALTTGERVTVDTLPAGHWVHVEDPQGVSRVLLSRLG